LLDRSITVEDKTESVFLLKEFILIVPYGRLSASELLLKFLKFISVLCFVELGKFLLISILAYTTASGLFKLQELMPILDDPSFPLWIGLIELPLVLVTDLVFSGVGWVISTLQEGVLVLLLVLLAKKFLNMDLLNKGYKFTLIKYSFTFRC
jgi:hypothetical protein